MISIDAEALHYRDLNRQIREADEDVQITNCLGQRFIAAGLDQKSVTVSGIPGNALGSYLNGAKITVHGNAQDAVGDTMNAGKIIIHGNVGDAAGYAMRGGSIYVKGNAGYRAGIHMKEYQEHRPVMMVGGSCGSFLGEYQAGGIIAVLGLTDPHREIVSNFPCTGMHGGKMFLRSDCRNIRFPSNVSVRPASDEDLKEILPYIEEFCRLFGYRTEDILEAPFTVITPDTSNPYQQMYVAN